MDFNTKHFELIEQLKQLKDSDPVEFCKILMDLLESDPDGVVEDDSTTVEIKTAALKRLIKYFESIESYENCSTLKTLIDRINGQK